MSEERKIFGPYWNGENYVYGDPLDIQMKLEDIAEGTITRLVAESRNNNDALRELLDIVGQAFDMVPWDRDTGKGATLRDKKITYIKFASWMSDQKKSAELEQISPERPLQWHR